MIEEEVRGKGNNGMMEEGAGHRAQGKIDERWGDRARERKKERKEELSGER